MHPAIPHLIELQRVDHQMAVLRAELESFPKRLREADTKLSGARAEIASAKDALAKITTERKKFECAGQEWKDREFELLALGGDLRKRVFGRGDFRAGAAELGVRFAEPLGEGFQFRAKDGHLMVYPLQLNQMGNRRMHGTLILSQSHLGPCRAPVPGPCQREWRKAARMRRPCFEGRVRKRESFVLRRKECRTSRLPGSKDAARNKSERSPSVLPRC